MFLSILLLKIITFQGEDSLKPKIQDRFFAEDKFKHFYFNLLLTNFLYFELRYDLKLEKEKTLYFSISIPLVFSIGKELIDKKRYGFLSLKDLTWDLFGIALSIYLLEFH
mgnify:CR=1 FL=1